MGSPVEQTKELEQQIYPKGRGLQSACGVPSSGFRNELLERAFPALSHPYRTPFQRDRECIVKARAFRRLAGKTQVFTSRASDHFRSRLTHTMEVAQIARTVACALGLNEDLAETLALVHDIGHPPFGHAGERALDRCLQTYGLRFDHNLHALRITEHFEQRYAAYRGLNLTLAVREGIVKHSRDYSVTDYPELAPYFLGHRPPLEAQIIDLADEIAYLTADLDDGVESGLLDIQHIRTHIRIVARAYEQVSEEHPGLEDRFLFHEALQLMQNLLTEDLIASTAANLAVNNLTTLDDVRAFPQRVATLSPEVESERLQEKKYLYDNLYTCPALTLEHDKAEEVVTFLFHFWMKYPEELPDGYFEDVAVEGLPRVVADYIAGMTDSYILEQYARAKRSQKLIRHKVARD